MKKLICSLIAVLFLAVVGCAHNTRLTYSKTFPISQNDSVWSRVNSYVYNNRIPVVSENQHVITTEDYTISRELSTNTVKVVVTTPYRYYQSGNTYYYKILWIDYIAEIERKRNVIFNLLQYASTGKSETMEENRIPRNIRQFFKHED